MHFDLKAVAKDILPKYARAMIFFSGKPHFYHPTALISQSPTLLYICQHLNCIIDWLWMQRLTKLKNRLNTAVTSQPYLCIVKR